MSVLLAYYLNSDGEIEDGTGCVATIWIIYPLLGSPLPGTARTNQDGTELVVVIEQHSLFVFPLLGGGDRENTRRWEPGFVVATQAVRRPSSQSPHAP